MLYVAIDQHRKQLTVNLRQEDGTVLLRRQARCETGAAALRQPENTKGCVGCSHG